MTRKKEFRAKQLLYRKMFKMTCLMARPYSTFKHENPTIQKMAF